MPKIIVPIEMPKTCSDCPFHMPIEYFPAGDGLYKKISSCRFAPDWLEDPWRSVQWQLDNKEDWCPLENVETEDTMTKFERDGIEEYERVWYEDD